MCAGCGGNPATSTIVVSRTGADVIIEEHASPMEPGQSTRRTVDGRTFATKFYGAYSDAKQVGPRLSVGGSTATLTDDGKIDRLSEPPGTRFVVMDGSVGGVFQLPAALYAAGGARVTIASVLFAFKGMNVTTPGTPGTRPQGVPAGDAGISIQMSPSDSDVGTLWYDPQTLVLDEFDLPGSQLTIKRIAHGAQPPSHTPVASVGPSGIAAGPDGNLWFTQSTGNAIGRISTSGVVRAFSKGLTHDAGAQGMAAGPDGNVWFAQWGANSIGRITTTGVVTEFELSAASRPSEIAAGPDGNLWFTESAAIGRITTAGKVTEWSTGFPDAANSGIAAGPDGNVWFAECQSNKIGRITPGGSITEFSAGLSDGAYPTGIAAGPDGNLWFTELKANKIGRITPKGAIAEFSTGLSPYSAPRSIAASGGYLWFTEQTGNRIGRIATDGTIVEFSAGIPPNANLSGIARGPDGNVWFTESDANTIGRIDPTGSITEFPI